MEVAAVGVEGQALAQGHLHAGAEHPIEQAAVAVEPAVIGNPQIQVAIGSRTELMVPEQIGLADRPVRDGDVSHALCESLLSAQVAFATPKADGVVAAKGILDLAAPLSEGRAAAVIAPFLVEHPVVHQAEAHPLVALGLVEEAGGDEGTVAEQAVSMLVEPRPSKS